MKHHYRPTASSNWPRWKRVALVVRAKKRGRADQMLLRLAIIELTDIVQDLTEDVEAVGDGYRRIDDRLNDVEDELNA